MVALILGNTAQRRDAKRFDWVFYVHGATEFVQSVTIRLHPTFKQPVRRLKEAPFEFPAAGWGTFDIDVAILWKAGGELHTVWPLQFDKPDLSTEFPVPEVALTYSVPPEAVLPMETDVSDGEDCPDVSSAVIVAGDEEPLPVVPVTPEPPALLRDVSAGSQPGNHARDTVTKRLREMPFLKHTHSHFKFGRGYEGPMRDPLVLWKSDKPPRQDHSAPKWLTASEFQDDREVMVAKVRQLALLMRLSRKTVAYTGAGISAAVVGQAALSGQNKVGWQSDPACAPPTFTHHALGFLGREGLLHGWVQQNHDGLPQRAGFPQERINEIHGSWFDPSNPVVKYSGTLHSRSYPWMRDDADTADLVLVLGTSLGGLNADQVATKAADRSLLPPSPTLGDLVPGAWVEARPPRGGASRRGLVTAVRENSVDIRFQDLDSDSEEEPDGLAESVTFRKSHPMRVVQGAAGGLGTVCINLQQTPHDGKMTLRLFGKSDDILSILLQELGYQPQVAHAPRWPSVHRALVPYDADGRRLPDGSNRKMWLDLTKGKEVRITPGHNIQGAQQPAYIHIGAPKPVTINGKTRQPGQGHGTVVKYDEASTSFVLNIDGVSMRLGIWWFESALRGGVEVLPVTNRKPQFE